MNLVDVETLAAALGISPAAVRGRLWRRGIRPQGNTSPLGRTGRPANLYDLDTTIARLDKRSPGDRK